MKISKILIATGVAVLAVASIAAAATFNTNLTVGSTGADVSALQNTLLEAGYSIPSISSGAADTGYFGSQTKAAVMAFQSANSIPNTGFVGPLTRAALNAGVTAAGAPSTVATCPVGFLCTRDNTVTPVCPIGYLCTLDTGTGTGTGTVIGGTVGIGTPGVAGTLAVSLWSTPSGVSVYKGQAYDVAAYKLQANASDMAITNFAIDFSDRIWLYANAITIKDETGAVIGTLSNLNSSNFSELTVGSDYRVSIPLSSFVIKAAQTKYLTVNLSFNAMSDRCTSTGSCSLYVLSAQVRAVDGTGVTDTETYTGSRLFTYNGSNIGQIYVTTDSSQPAAKLVQISTSVQTQNVLLGVFSIKSANIGSTMQGLTLKINTNGKANAGVNELFNNVQIKINGLTYSASNIDTTTGSNTNYSSTVSFTGLQVPLTADAYTPISVYVTVAPDSNVSHYLNGASASTTLQATTNNPSVIDATYNNITVNAATITNNDQTFTDSGVGIPSLAVSYGTLSCSTALTVCNQSFSIVYGLTAGNNAIYVSKTVSTAITSTDTTGLTITSTNFSDDNTNGDQATYFYIAPGASKTFTAQYRATGDSTTQGGTFQVTSLNYGTDSTTMTNQLSNSTITNALKVVLFH